MAMVGGGGGKVVYVLGQSQHQLQLQGNKRQLAPAPLLHQDMIRCRSARLAPAAAAASTPHNHSQQQQPASVARRNARERNRVKQVNNGFATLRQHIPAGVAAALGAASPGAQPASASSPRSQANKKLSKVETLRLAVEYIRSLQRMIEEYEAKVPTGAGGRHAGYYTPPCSEVTTGGLASAPSSPAPSYSSDYAQQTALYAAENYENYSPEAPSPEDDELLDAISWWQQQ